MCMTSNFVLAPMGRVTSAIMGRGALRRLLLALHTPAALHCKTLCVKVFY